jgi:drug/metabolite transporter (DMT)-like permease
LQAENDLGPELPDGLAIQYVVTFAPSQNSTPRAAYVHVPFCAHRCGYCNFTVVAGRDDLIDAYLAALEKELHALESPRAVGFALANAVVIALYTVVDALGARTSGNALQYVAALFMLDGWPFALLVLHRRGWRVAWPYAQRRAPLALVGALASLGSYGIALWAMTRAPVATVAALRETSVLFAALLGSWLLKEGFTPRRALGTAAIVAGVMALRLG